MLITVSGQSATGKTTLAEALARDLRSFAMVQATTTRAPRSSDKEGQYRHVDLLELRRQRGWLWRKRPFRKREWYALHPDQVESALRSAEVALTDITFEQVITLHQHFPVDLALYFETADEEEMRRRMLKRGGMDEATIGERLKKSVAWDDAARKSGFSFVFVSNFPTFEGKLAHVKHLILMAYTNHQAT